MKPRNNNTTTIDIAPGVQLVIGPEFVTQVLATLLAQGVMPGADQAPPTPKPPKGNGHRKGYRARRWTDAEQTFLRANYQTMKPSEIARELKRSTGAVKVRKYSLGLA